MWFRFARDVKLITYLEIVAWPGFRLAEFSIFVRAWLMATSVGWCAIIKISPKQSEWSFYISLKNTFAFFEYFTYCIFDTWITARNLFS